MLRNCRFSVQFPQSHVKDDFVPINRAYRGKNSTEYRDVYNKTANAIMKYKIHNHSRCGTNGSRCEHYVHGLPGKDEY